MSFVSDKIAAARARGAVIAPELEDILLAIEVHLEKPVAPPPPPPPTPNSDPADPFAH